MPAPIIETEGFTLRPIEVADIPAMVEGMAHWDVVRMLTTPPHPYRSCDADSFVASAPNRPWLWAIATDRLIGTVEIGSHLGYWLAPSHWGQGIMTRAAALALDSYFRGTEADLVVSGCFDDNPASHRVLGKLGFHEIGRRPVRSRARGETVRHIDMRLWRAGWARRRATLLDRAARSGD